jgi:L-lactate dehydrogenase complex protein LldG
MTRSEIIDLFVSNATKVAAETIRVSDTDELSAALAKILTDGDSVFCPVVTEKEKACVLPERMSVSDYAIATVCVEEVFGGIAETGSLICSSRDGKPVQAGLLPAHHVAIVSGEKIYETLDDFFSGLGDSPPTNITLETGPSRTADIELTLTIGVHGPEKLTIIVFE